MKTLDEYLAETRAPQPPEASGIECPECSKELMWDSPSLICTNPQMRRLICPGCEFSQVVPV